jgi:predicted metal-dependent hydrolase
MTEQNSINMANREKPLLACDLDKAGILSREDIRVLVATWSNRLKVMVHRLQIRPMKNKWRSISTAGTLTLADDLRRLPLDLAEYVVVHELLRLKFPDHRKGWQVSMGIYLSHWREYEQRLQSSTGTLSRQ